MFYDREDCHKLADGIYVFKNYLNKDSINKVKERLASLTENAVYDKTLIDWYGDVTPLYAITEFMMCIRIDDIDKKKIFIQT